MASGMGGAGSVRRSRNDRFECGRRGPSILDGDRRQLRPGALGLSTRAEQGSHLEVADGQGGLLEQSGQLTLDDLGGPEGGAVVDDEDFFMAGQRHRLGAETATDAIITRT
jgi:hypothetical protein